MPKDDRVYVGHMLDMARKALAAMGGKTRKDFDGDEILRIALAHMLQVIGEAGRKVSPEFCAKHPAIPWKRIVGMRHKVVHDYLSIDDDVVFETVDKELRALVVQLESLA